MKRTSLKYSVISMVLVVLLVLGGCGLIPDIEVNAPPAPTPAPPQPTTPAPPQPTTPAPPQPTTPINPDWIPPAGDQAQQLPDFVSVIAKVKPSVVAINTKVPGYSIFTGAFVQEGAGSGWIVDEEGYIVTNNHVVEGAESVSITLDDGQTYSAKTVRTDPLTDLAIVKIDATDLPAADIGDSSQLRLGDWVIAIGNSLGLGISATKGIVSAKGISISAAPGQTLYDLIQTDAAINPGNSGGPLVNMAGEVIGINSVKIREVGVEGMGYAISSNIAVPIIQELITAGYVSRPWLGVGLWTVDQQIARRYDLAVTEGVLVTEVATSSPADKAGLKADDVITEFAGQKAVDVDELVKAIRAAQIGQEIDITYWRAKSQHTTSATLIERPPSS